MAKLKDTRIFGNLTVDGEITNKASTSSEGVVKLNNTVTSSSTTEAATASAVKQAYDKGNHSHPYASTSVATASVNGLMSSSDKTKLDGIATSANNYTHPTTSGNKHIPSGGSSGQILRWSADGTATWGSENNTTYSVVTTSVNGLMSSTDKTKLDGIATGANNYTHPTTSGNKHIPSGGSSGQILRWSADGTAAWGSDNNTTYSLATQSSNGLMSSSDKIKLDGIATGATKTILNNTVTSTSTTEAATANAVKTAYDLAAGKANTSHTHTKSQISDFPISLPANGGNADTVDGRHADGFTKYTEQPEGISLDTAFETGIHWIFNATGTLPTGYGQSDNDFLLQVFRSSLTNSKWQIQFLQDMRNNRIFTRRQNTGVFGSWAEVYHSDKKPTATDVGALPITGGDCTGAVGANYNGKRMVMGVGGDDTYLYNSKSGGYLQMKDNGELQYNSALVYHSGNTSDFLRIGTNQVVKSIKEFISQTVGADYGQPALQIRETLSVGNAQATVEYAPAIGFHWANRTAGSIAMHSDGFFHFRAQGYSSSNNIYRQIVASGLQLKDYGIPLECGQYIDFHNIGSNVDYSNRLESGNGYMSASAGFQIGNSNGNLKRTTISTASPSGGSNNDVWIQYT